MPCVSHLTCFIPTGAAALCWCLSSAHIRVKAGKTPRTRLQSITVTPRGSSLLSHACFWTFGQPTMTGASLSSPLIHRSFRSQNTPETPVGINYHAKQLHDNRREQHPRKALSFASDDGVKAQAVITCAQEHFVKSLSVKDTFLANGSSVFFNQRPRCAQSVP